VSVWKEELKFMSINHKLHLQCRILVGFLGERSQFSWWPTVFFSAPSRSFLEPIFSKTVNLARYHGVVEAARRHHDEHLNVGCYHLFRLPEEVEQDLHIMVKDSVLDEFIGEALVSSESALMALGQLAAGHSRSAEGPTLIGRVSELDTNAIVRQLAGVYATAFREDKRAYPYLLNSVGSQ
jgi:hypothetical protein